MSKLMDAALDPSCLLCLTPGGWWSPVDSVLATGGSGNSYPERLGLIAATNISITSGSFSASNPAVAARIDTAIDLRGSVSSYTVVVDAELVPLTAPGQHQELAGQGAAYASGTVAIASLAWHYYSATYAALIVSSEVAGARAAKSFVVPHSETGRHTLSATVSVNPVAQTTTLTAYLNGAVLGSQTYVGIPVGAASASTIRYTMLANSTIGYAGKIYSGALFAKGLTAGQIADLSN